MQFYQHKMASSTKSDDTCSSKYEDHDIYISAEEDEELFELDIEQMDQVWVQSGRCDDDSKKEALLSNCLMPVTCISNAKPIKDHTRITATPLNIEVNPLIGSSYRSGTASSRRMRNFWHGQSARVATSQIRVFL